MREILKASFLLEEEAANEVDFAEVENKKHSRTTQSKDAREWWRWEKAHSQRLVWESTVQSSRQPKSVVLKVLLGRWEHAK